VFIRNISYSISIVVHAEIYTEALLAHAEISIFVTLIESLELIVCIGDSSLQFF
jgi:hypothetical protein